MKAVKDLEAEEQNEIFREAIVMVLYVSVVEIAELAALPEDHFSGHTTGPVKTALLAILWGTAIGLAIAHWFAFRLAAPAFRGERLTSLDTKVGLAQVGGAVFVAVVTSVPILLFSAQTGRDVAADLPAVIIGFVGYLVARRAGRGRIAAFFFGLTALALGLLVAEVKNVLSGH
jgi:hypothetical protein